MVNLASFETWNLLSEYVIHFIRVHNRWQSKCTSALEIIIVCKVHWKISLTVESTMDLKNRSLPRSLLYNLLNFECRVKTNIRKCYDFLNFRHPNVVTSKSIVDSITKIIFQCFFTYCDNLWHFREEKYFHLQI